MEGPSLLLAAEQLAPFIGKILKEVNGNTKIGKERMDRKKILDIFSWGKHLVFQFDNFALRIHFMLFGSFQAVINGKKVTGDYPTKNIPKRLQFICSNGEINFFNCSLKYIESSKAKEEYDFTIDILSNKWDKKQALSKILLNLEEEIADVLLDQTIFSGVGNIIKNEVLFIEKISPLKKVKELSPLQIKKIIKTAQSFSKQFYLWRKDFVLSKNYKIYRRSVCPSCGGKINKKKTGKRNRFSYICFQCQK